MEFKSFWNIGIWEDKLQNLEVEYWTNLLYKLLPNPEFSYKNGNGTHFTIDYLTKHPSFIPLISQINSIGTKLNSNLKLVDLWGNIAPPLTQDNIHHHKTNQNQISGVLYLQTPQNSGNIVFVNPMDANIKSFYTPNPKSIVFFNSSLLHYVEINRSKEDRISIAFDFS
jgi:hypothetical protein